MNSLEKASDDETLPPGCHRPEQRPLAYVRWQLYVPWHDEYIHSHHEEISHIWQPPPPRCPGCLYYFYIIIGAGRRRNQWPGLACMRRLTDGDLGQNWASGFWWEEGVSGMAGRSRHNLNSQNVVHVMSVQPWFPHRRTTLRVNEGAVTSPPRRQE